MIRILVIAIVCSIQPALAQRSLNVELDRKVLDEKYEITTLRFYLSNIQFHTTDGVWHSEKNSVHLIDLEEPDSWKIALPEEVGELTIDSITFLIGTDSLTNVSGILEGDLDPIKGMYWAWNSGYINFKVEGKKREANTDFEYHLGGYLPPHSTARSVVFGCHSNNENVVLRLNLSQFLDSINMIELNEVMIPGPDAAMLSDRLVNCFSLD